MAASGPFTLESLTFSGAVSACGLGSAQGTFTYDKATGETTFGIELDPSLPPPFAAGATAIIFTVDHVTGGATSLVGSFRTTLDGLPTPSPVSFSLYRAAA